MEEKTNENGSWQGSQRRQGRVYLAHLNKRMPCARQIDKGHVRTHARRQIKLWFMA